MPVPHRAHDGSRYDPTPEPCSRWLIEQRERGDWIDDLATVAPADRSLLQDGDPEAVRTHLRGQQADGDVF